MTELTAIAVAACALLGVCVTWHLLSAAAVWRRLSGERVVTCPETGHPEAVRIDVARAARTTIGNAAPDVRLAACTRWRARGPCDEMCLMEAADPGSRVSTMASEWYAGKRCAYCDDPLRDESFVDHHVALLGPDGTTREWSEVPPEGLPEALSTSRPVCWNCHIAETFRRRYPQLVTDRTNAPRTS